MTTTQNLKAAAAEFLATKTTSELIEMFELLCTNYDAQVAFAIERTIVKRENIADEFAAIFYADEFTGTVLDAIKIAMSHR